MRWIVLMALLGTSSVATLAVQPSKEHPALQIRDERGTEKSPLIIRGSIATSLPPLTPVQSAAENRKAEDDHKASRANVGLAWLTITLAGIGLWQAWMFRRQLTLAKDQLQLAKDQLVLTEKAMAAGTVAANAAKDSADALPKIERAYLFVKVRINNVNLADGKFWIQFNVEIKNYGKTPAVLRLLRNYSSWEDVVPQELIKHELASKNIPDGFVIGSGEGHSELCEITLNQDEWSEFQSLNKTVYIVGSVDYRDVLNEERRTSYCWHCIPTTNGVNTSIIPSKLNRYT